jgi:hypothetical protein
MRASHLAKNSAPQPGAVLSSLALSQRTLRSQTPGGARAGDYDFAKIAVNGVPLQCRLAVGDAHDPAEAEADRVAERVMRMPDTAAPISAAGSGTVQRKCASCENDEAGQIQRKADGGSHAGEAPSIVHDVVSSSGQPLDSATRAFMEPRFGHDFSNVRVHAGEKAAQSARAVNARAYTVGRDVVFGDRQYAPSTSAGAQLLAHELAHSVQQSGAGARNMVRRDTFTGGSGTTAKDKDRPLIGFAGPIPATANPGGTIVPNSASVAQNCAGDSTSINKYINWPNLGIEIPGVQLPADWTKANSFVPTGCTRVNCSGVDVNNTRCKKSELDSIVFLYKWPETFTIKATGQLVAGTQSDFHMIGRDAGGLPSGWHSKMDRREKVVDIRDPLQSLHDAYPHTLKPDRIVSKLCFCCDQKKMATA